MVRSPARERGVRPTPTVNKAKSVMCSAGARIAARPRASSRPLREYQFAIRRTHAGVAMDGPTLVFWHPHPISGTTRRRRVRGLRLDAPLTPLTHPASASVLIRREGSLGAPFLQLLRTNVCCHRCVPCHVRNEAGCPWLSRADLRILAFEATRPLSGSEESS